MNIALLGPSGAGKGTYADIIAPYFNLQHLSTGDILRQSLISHSALGILAYKYMKRGELVPDEVIDAIIEEYLTKTDPNQGILFDGFPRTQLQATLLEEYFQRAGRTLDAAIYLKASEPEIARRLRGRLICRKCQRPTHRDFVSSNVCTKSGCFGELYQREDDSQGIPQNRLKVYMKESPPLIDYFQQLGKLLIVDSERDISVVKKELIEIIENLSCDEWQKATSQEVKSLKDVKPLPPIVAGEDSHRSLDVILIGAPGSGKGTQAEIIGKNLRIQHIATGDLFREHLNNNTELGRLARSYMNRGELVPNNITASMVRERLGKNDTLYGVVLDGFPRTVPQAEALTEILNDFERHIDGVIYIRVSDDEIVERLSGRLICKKCQTPFHKKFNPFKTCPNNECQGEHLYQRDDDNPETVRARLRTFHKQTIPLIEYYRNQGLLFEVDGEGDVKHVSKRVLEVCHQLEALYSVAI